VQLRQTSFPLFSCSFSELTADDLRRIDSAPAQITIEGARYPEALERITGR
jgi:hypothetical protein